MVVSDVMKKLLSVQGASQKQGQISVSSFDNIRNLVDSVATVKSIFIGQTVLDSVTEGYTFAEGFCDAGKQCRIDDWCFPSFDKSRCGGIPPPLKCRTSNTRGSFRVDNI